jgi:hypothetical protein
MSVLVLLFGVSMDSQTLYTIYHTPAGNHVYAKVYLQGDSGRYILQDGSNATGRLTEVKYNVRSTKSFGLPTTATTGRWEFAGQSGYFVFRAPDQKGRVNGFWGYYIRNAPGAPVGEWNGVVLHGAAPPPAKQPTPLKASAPKQPNEKDVTVRFPIIQCVKARAGFFSESTDELYIAVVGLKIKTAGGVTKATEPIHSRLPGDGGYYLYSSGTSNSRRGRSGPVGEPMAWSGRLGDGDVVFLSFVFADQQNTTAQDFLRTLATVGKFTGEAGSIAIGNEEARKLVTNSGKELLAQVDRGDYPLGQLSVKLENAKGAVKMELQGGVEYGKATSSSGTTLFFELSGKRNDSRYLAAVSADVE